MMRHPSWDWLISRVHDIGVIYGSSIYDARCGKSWDAGQAICAEQYGAGWNTEPEFIAANQIPNTEPAPVEALRAAQRLVDGKSDWAVPLAASKGTKNG